MPFVYAILLALAVYLAEHLLLTRRYRMKSSLQKLFAFGPSARTDLSFVVLYVVGFRWLYPLAILLSAPGLVYFATGWALSGLEWRGLLAGVTASPIAAGALMLLGMDLALYLSHRALHAVPFLWRTHQLHHGADEMTVANGSRVALGELFLNEFAILAVMVPMFGLQRPEVVLPVLVIRQVVDMLQHSDLPWDYGAFGKLVASPRYHRLHHSVDPRDYNQHFADIFPVWDYLFGTASKRFREDPTCVDGCSIGLGGESARLNCGVRALWHETIPYRLWLALRAHARLARLIPSQLRRPIAD
jgi:sterol desaturase/sphingolipid hydroxylase (fatty acid hydroxylase superfamily)